MSAHVFHLGTKDVKTTFSAFFPITSSENQYDWEYLQTSDKHQKRTCPFCNRRKHWECVRRSEVSDSWAHISQWCYGQSYRLIKLDTAKTKHQYAGHYGNGVYGCKCKQCLPDRWRYHAVVDFDWQNSLRMKYARKLILEYACYHRQSDALEGTACWPGTPAAYHDD